MHSHGTVTEHRALTAVIGVMQEGAMHGVYLPRLY